MRGQQKSPDCSGLSILLGSAILVGVLGEDGVQAGELCRNPHGIDAFPFGLILEQFRVRVGGETRVAQMVQVGSLAQRVDGPHNLAELPQVAVVGDGQRIAEMELELVIQILILHFLILPIERVQAVQMVMVITIAEVAEAPIPVAIERRATEQDATAMHGTETEVCRERRNLGIQVIGESVRVGLHHLNPVWCVVIIHN